MRVIYTTRTPDHQHHGRIDARNNRRRPRVKPRGKPRVRRGAGPRILRSACGSAERGSPASSVRRPGAQPSQKAEAIAGQVCITQATEPDPARRARRARQVHGPRPARPARRASPACPVQPNRTKNSAKSQARGPSRKYRVASRAARGHHRRRYRGRARRVRLLELLISIAGNFSVLYR